MDKDDGKQWSDEEAENKKNCKVTTFDTPSEFKSAQNSKKQLRLKYLLDQASVYSKFLSSKFVKHQQEQQLQDEDECLLGQASKTLVTQPSIVTGGKLKDYQLEGLEWLVSLYENGLNGILADEMGLGKTLQCIAFLAFLREKGVTGPFLIAAPLSTLANWGTEIEHFAPSLPHLVYHGSKTERAALRESYFGAGKNGRVSGRIGNPETFPIVITSYEIIMNDKAYLEAFRWKFIIVDEGHRIKNLNCKLIKTLKDFDSANRLLLTGTPLQNNLAELWSLLNFLLPDIFDDLDVFQRWFDGSQIIGNEDHSTTRDELSSSNRLSIISNLHNILRPFLLRRLKSEVEFNLPPKKEYIVYCPMSSLQRGYYSAALTHTLSSFIESQVQLNMDQKKSEKSNTTIKSKSKHKKSKVDKDVLLGIDSTNYDQLSDDAFLKSLETEANHYFDHEENDSVFLTKQLATGSSEALRSVKLQNVFMQLRKVCNHPYLFFYPFNPETDELKVGEQMISDSGKLAILDQLLSGLLARNHRVLLFSQMTGILDILSDFLEFRGTSFCRFDGATSQPEREAQLAKFRGNSEIPVFLLSTRAAGLGINLTAADTVIFYDSDWNPQMDLQAQDRAHRIGQTKPVLIYRLATADSIESKILDRASSKRKLEKLVIHKSKFKGIKQLARNTESSLQAEELRRILKEETVGISHNSSHEEPKGNSHCIQRLSREDLAALLDRSPQVFNQAEGLELKSAMIRIAKPANADLNDALTGMK